MAKKVKIFFDSEFTGLHQKSTFISIGLISEGGKVFYAEFNDYDVLQLDSWLQTNVIENLIFNDYHSFMPENVEITDMEYLMKGSKGEIAVQLERWLKQFGQVEMWSDCLSYDWVLFENLWGSAFNRPEFISYIPMDICTLFRVASIDPDISREKFISNSVKGEKHNALYDAKVIKACYTKLKTVYFKNQLSDDFRLK